MASAEQDQGKGTPIVLSVLSIATILYALTPVAGSPASAPSPQASRAIAPSVAAVPAEPEPEAPPRRRTRWVEIEVQSPPAALETLAAAGAPIYAQHCTTCHGVQGKGDGPAAALREPRPRNFTRGLFKFKTSVPDEMPFDDDLYRTVSQGIPAAGMPAYGDLTAFERWALVAYVKTLTKHVLDDGRVIDHFKRSPAQTRLKFPADPGPGAVDLAKGRELFQSKIGCVACHGTTGRGDGPSAATLVDVFDHPIAVPDIERGEVSFKSGHRPDDIYRILVSGMAGTPMPSFSSSLGEADRWNLAHYITSLYKPLPPGERTFLTAGCVSCHTVGKGKIIGPDLAGVAQRRTKEWLARWLADPPGMIATDADARKLFEEHLVPMPSPGLTRKEIDQVIEYLQTLPPAKPAAAPKNN